MTVKDFFSDFKVWIGILVVISGITIGIIRAKNIPERVKQVEKVTAETVKHVEKMATSVDMYMMEQRTIQVQQEKRENLMLELIRSK